MKLVPDMFSVSELVGLIDDGQLAIPEFQRPFVWRPPAVADLIVSVARRWPIGSLLLLEGPQDFAVRPIAAAPGLTSAQLLVLDGQQRITALYHAIGDRSADEVYVVDFQALRSDGELGDEHITARRRRTFERQYPDVQSRAKSGLLTVVEAADTSRFADWQRFLPPDLQAGAFKIRDELLGGLQEYSIPAVRLSRGIEMGALSKIFETINRTGERLRPFDLMVARLYPHDFNLVDRWQEAWETQPFLRAFDVDGLEILRLIALRLAVEMRRAGRSEGPRGIRGGDVLKLEPAVVKNTWNWAINAYTSALEFLQRECGVCGLQLLPSETMVLPVALSLAQGKVAEPTTRRFFWSAALTQAYAQGANTQAVRDARELLSEVLDGGGLPETVRRFSPDEATLQDVRRRNESFLRGLMCLLVVDGALDISSGRALAELTDVAPRHIFPAEWLAARGISADTLLNFTASAQDLRPRHSGELPDDVLAGVDRATLLVHGIDPDPAILGDWTEFVHARLRFWLDRLNRLADELRT